MQGPRARPSRRGGLGEAFARPHYTGPLESVSLIYALDFQVFRRYLASDLTVTFELKIGKHAYIACSLG